MSKLFTLATAAVGMVVGLAVSVPLLAPQGATAAPVAAAVAMDGPVTINMGPTGPGLRINGNQNSLDQPVAVYDYLGNPIFYVASDGGAGVTGDDFSVFAGGDVFNPTVRLYQNGAVKLGGKDGPTLYAGKADPRLAPPQHDLPFAAGDRYMWNSAKAGWPTLVYNGQTWVYPAVTPPAAHR